MLLINELTDVYLDEANFSKAGYVFLSMIRSGNFLISFCITSFFRCIKLIWVL